MTNTRITALITALAAGVLSLPNHAQIITHWYFGAGLLNSDHEVPDQNLSGPFSGGGTQTLNTVADTSDNGWKLFGGYQLHKHFAVEAAFIDLGKFNRVGTSNLIDVPIVTAEDQIIIDVESDLDTELNPQGLSLTGIALLPLFKGFSLNARAGLLFTNYQAKTRSVTRIPAFILEGDEFPATTIRDTFTETVNDIEFSAGLGFDYRPLADWSIGFQWERYFDVGSDDINVEEDVDIVGVSVTYHY
ncbi:outer membrane beta-barrel protein [Exilibacterium tricleocarpae]|nr:outer membrane beta-barrel protein [Exilibacterium tricleocarpae]